MHSLVRELLGQAMEAGVSFGARGNLLLLAPPLVIGEGELSGALDLLDRLLGQLTAKLAATGSSLR